MLGELSSGEVEKLLTDNIIGRIGCTDGNMVYIVPVTYVYDGKYIIMHSRDGMKIDIMRKNASICFEVDVVHDLGNWESVIARGSFEELTNEEDRYYAMKKLVDKTLKLKVSETALPPHMSDNRVHPHQPGNVKVIVYRLALTEKTGRYEKN
jgi:nitroimidazol reductase NimA-like FMN-containing flavoprotein (pyridoxamine 5'-phosphate oxidase superfamily)